MRPVVERRVEGTGFEPLTSAVRGAGTKSNSGRAARAGLIGSLAVGGYRETGDDAQRQLAWGR